MPAEGGEPRRLSPAEAHAEMERGRLYVDVSSVPEFELGHPRGAYNVPLQEPGPDGLHDNAEFLRVMQACFAADAPLVIGCRTGQRSLVAARRLLKAGFVDVVEQRAGFDGARGPFGELREPGWRAAGLPSATAEEVGREWTALKARARR